MKFIPISSLRRLTCLLLCLLMFPCLAFSERAYLIPDSSTRSLTRDELWQWDYESLGYILNEIFARHGYNFIPGQKYDYYFRCMPWYTPNADSDNQRACYSQLSSIEWANEHLVKEVRAEMRSLGTQNKGTQSVWDYFSAGFDTLQGFDYINVKSGQKWPVYAAPSTSSWRGANGKAMVSTSGNVFAAGWESGWLLVMYETNNGSVRVGYVNQQDMKKIPDFNRTLSFDYTRAQITARCTLTDDPARCFAAVVNLQPGDSVTYLTSFFNQQAWAYVETTVNSQTVRGFIPANCIDLPLSSDDEPIIP